MKKLIVFALFLNAFLLAGRFWQELDVHAGVELKCATKNGDVNGDGELDISDPIALLGKLFLGAPAELAPLCASRLPDTGQTTCYDAAGEVIDCTSDTCPGQDGFYATGCSESRFVVNIGDGTVTDTCTGLMWQRGFNGASWCDALRSCESLTMAGHSDWRLPNINELQSIVNYGKANAAIYLPFPQATGSLWSSTTVVTTTNSAWNIRFFRGDVDSFGLKSVVKGFRAVRTIQPGE